MNSRKFSYSLIKALFVIAIVLEDTNGQYGFMRRLPFPAPATSYNNGLTNNNGQTPTGHCCNCTNIPHQHFNPQLFPLSTTPQTTTNPPFSPISSQNIPNYLNPHFSDDRSAVNQYPGSSPAISHIPSTINNNANIINSNMNNILPNNNINVNQIPASSTESHYAGTNLDSVIHFKLFTRESPIQGEDLKVNNQELLNASKFSVSRPTKFILHGFADGNEEKIGDWVSAMKQAYLSASDSNVIVVDYSYFSGYLFFWTNLPLFASSKLADMAYFLESKGANMGDFHIIGKSWGAHIAGMAGRMCKGKLGRISGLEPAGPSTNLVGHEHQLDFTDAKLVDIVHVNGKRFFFHGTRFGLVPPTGHVDIYPNFAEKASGCPDESSNFRSFNFRSCKRGRGVKYFVDTIQYPFAHPICLCPSFPLYKTGECYCGHENTISMGQISNLTIGVFQMAATPIRNNRNFLLGSRRQPLPLWG